MEFAPTWWFQLDQPFPGGDTELEGAYKDLRGLVVPDMGILDHCFWAMVGFGGAVGLWEASSDGGEGAYGLGL